MSIQKFPLATVQKVRQYIQKTLTLSASEQHPQALPSDWAGVEQPEPESLDALGDFFRFGGFDDSELAGAASEAGWFLSAANPAAALLKLPGLHLKPGLRLVSYLYRTETSGRGIIWAVPEALSTTAQLEKALVASNPEQPPQPAGALPDFMEAIDGDRSPASFLVASILRREFQEFGALNQHCNWSHHRLIDTVPMQLVQQVGTDQLKDLTPRVRILPDGQAAVEFFTCRVAPPAVIFRHIDLYPVDRYAANCLNRAVSGNRR
jgi:hypothetical protein